MTTIPKTLITAAIAAAVGTGFYGARRVSSLQDQLQALQRPQHPLAEQARKSRQELDDVARNLAAVQQQNEQLRCATAELVKLRGATMRLRADMQELAQLKRAISATRNDRALEATVQRWLARVAELKLRLEQMTDRKTPELQFLTEQDWLNATKDLLDTDINYRRSMSALRKAAEGRFAHLALKALRRYFQANNEQLPTDLSQLQAYFECPVDDAILQRWEILTGDKLRGLGIDNTTSITQKAAVDEEFDVRYGVNVNGVCCSGWRAVSE